MPSAAVRAAPGALVLLSGKRSSVCLQSSTYPPRGGHHGSCKFVARKMYVEPEHPASPWRPCGGNSARATLRRQGVHLQPSALPPITAPTHRRPRPRLRLQVPAQRRPTTLSSRHARPNTPRIDVLMVRKNPAGGSCVEPTRSLPPCSSNRGGPMQFLSFPPIARPSPATAKTQPGPHATRQESARCTGCTRMLPLMLCAPPAAPIHPCMPFVPPSALGRVGARCLTFPCLAGRAALEPFGCCL